MATKSKTKRDRDRIAWNGRREDALSFLFRFGGGTATQLACWFDLVDGYSLHGLNQPSGSSLRAAYRTLASLKDSKLTRRVAVVREHAGRKRPEDFTYLSPVNGGQAIVWGGAECGFLRDREAREAYRRHQLPARPEHASWRTDLLLMVLSDATARGEPDIPISETWGESAPQYPYLLARETDAAGEPLKLRSRRKYDPAIPDGTSTMYWDDGLSCRVDWEVERWTRTGAGGKRPKGVIPKIERHTMVWERIYSLAERRERKVFAPLIERLQAERAEALEPRDKKWYADEIERVQEQQNQAKSGSFPYRLPLPENVLVPLVFVLRTQEAAESMYERVREQWAKVRLERLEALRERFGGYGIEVGRYIHFVGWDELLREGAQATSLLPLFWPEEGGELNEVTLRQVAEERDLWIEGEK